jgi:hypothetical protein
VIAGRSVVEFRRAEGDSVPAPKCFGFVQTYDQKPRRRVWEVMKSQGMQENQQVVFMSDGGEDVRQLQEYLHPNSEHLIDWFHITMRLTVLQQQTKALQAERPDENAAAASKQIESVKHLLWHGNVDEALDRIDSLFTGALLVTHSDKGVRQQFNGVVDAVYDSSPASKSYSSVTPCGRPSAPLASTRSIRDTKVFRGRRPPAIRLLRSKSSRLLVIRPASPA